jgi:hypothetical protein
VAAWFALTACGGGAAFEAGVYRDGEARFQIAEPSGGWSAVDVAGENDLAWFNDELSSVIQVNASCDPALDIPLRVLTDHLLFGFTEREVRSADTIAMDAREALRTHLRAKLDGVPRELVLVVMKKNGCVYDFSLVAPPGAAFEHAEGAFDALTRGFRSGDAQ